MGTRKLFCEPNQIIGRDFVFLEEVEPIITTRKDSSSGIRKIRMANVICPYCKESHIQPLLAVYRGKVKSCGCLKNKLASERISEWNTENCTKNITGETAGDWTALYPTGRKSKNGTSYWMFECKAGHKKEMLISNFGRNLCCMDCNHRSNGERKIATLLEDCGIVYEYEKRFNDCINTKTGYKLSFDFYLPEYKSCIEYDGEQHFFAEQNKTNNFYNETEVQLIQYRDKIKDEYCVKKNYKLIRIPYWDYDKLDKDYLLRLLK